MKFSEPVIVSGKPTLPVTIGEVLREAVWNGKGSGSKSLVFSTNVRAGDYAPRGVQVTGAIGVAGGARISDKANNALVPEVNADFPKLRVDTIGPRVVEFGQITSAVARKATRLQLRVAFSEPVVVSGKPTIPLFVGDQPKSFVYTRGSGGNILTFSCRVPTGTPGDGPSVSLPMESIWIGRAIITDRARNLASTLSQPDVKIKWSTVRDAGNAPDATGYGDVDYEYRIGTYEITNEQYAMFLNAVAQADKYNLYDPTMGKYEWGGITRSGSVGSFVYSVKAGMESRPACEFDWNDALRFANWMSNGQPVGAQTATTTEDGAYYLRDRYTMPVRNAGALFTVPTENEWYKAAYYGGSTGEYFDYATQSSQAPAPVTSGPTGDGSAGGSGNFANFTYYAGNVTNVGTNGGPSYYGTFDQSGNVGEYFLLQSTWTDIRLMGWRGGGFGEDAIRGSSEVRDGNLGIGSYVSGTVGVRLSSSFLL